MTRAEYVCYTLHKVGETMPRKVKDLIKIIEQDGWVLVCQRGSHRQYKHPTKSGRVTISGHKLSADVSLDLENSILKQAGLK